MRYEPADKADTGHVQRRLCKHLERSQVKVVAVKAE